MERPILTLIAALAAAPFFTSGTSAPQDPLAYGMPSAAGVTYQVSDTMVMAIQSPMGPMDMKAFARTTLTVTFEADPGGFRATAQVTDFAGSVTNPMMGAQSMGSEAVQGAVVVVVGPGGVVEMVGGPNLSPEAGQFSLFEGLGYDVFPTLPARAVTAGDSWTDTLTWSASAQEMETTSTTVRTFTLGDEIAVDGRSLQSIAVSSTVEISGSGSQGGMTLDQKINGTITGYYYWDAEAGLLHSAELMRDLEGETTMPGMPPIPMTMKGPQRITREN